MLQSHTLTTMRCCLGFWCFVRHWFGAQKLKIKLLSKCTMRKEFNVSLWQCLAPVWLCILIVMSIISEIDTEQDFDLVSTDSDTGKMEKSVVNSMWCFEEKRSVFIFKLQQQCSLCWFNIWCKKWLFFTTKFFNRAWKKAQKLRLYWTRLKLVRLSGKMKIAMVLQCHAFNSLKNHCNRLWHRRI